MGVKNFLYSIFANGISTLITVIVTLILPKITSVEGYGLFQYYIMLTGYIGVLHLGWADGLYLRLCGTEYGLIDFAKMHKQLSLFVALQVIWAILILAVSLFVVDKQKTYIFFALAFTIIILNFKAVLSYILQATYRIMDSSRASILGNLTYFFIFCILLIFRVKKYQWYIVTYIIGMVITLLIDLYYCKDIFKCRTYIKRNVKTEIVNNINAGSKIMIAAFVGILIINNVRWNIERVWDVETFAKISLTLSASNLFMTFINAIATVLLPMLRRMEKKRIFLVYEKLNDILLLFLSGSMLLYFPVKTCLSMWLPAYAESLNYMAILFPICISESKTVMLLITYLKLIRQEKGILEVNVIVAVVSFFLSIISVSVLRNIFLAVCSIVILLALRCILLEIYLSKYINITLWKNVLTEILISVFFIYSSWCIGGSKGILIYGACYIVYCIIKRRAIYDIFAFLKKYRS